MKYKLLAADMDATALNSKKELTPANVNAMEKAIAQGKTVVFSTGREYKPCKAVYRYGARHALCRNRVGCVRYRHANRVKSFCMKR